MAASFSARGRGSTCPPGPRGAGNTHLAPPPIGPAGRGRGSAAGAAAGVRGRDCGRDAQRGPGLRRSCGGATVEEQPGPLRSLSVPRRRPDRAFRRRAALHRDGATPQRRGGIARSCRDMSQRAVLLRPCSGQLRPPGGRAGERATPPATAPEGPPLWSGAGGASVVPGSTVAAGRPAAPESSSLRGRPGAQSGKAFSSVHLKAAASQLLYGSGTADQVVC